MWQPEALGQLFDGLFTHVCARNNFGAATILFSLILYLRTLRASVGSLRSDRKISSFYFVFVSYIYSLIICS
jgi:hypothetical protein